MTPAIRTPPERATGSSSESKLTATSARESGLIDVAELRRVDGRADGVDLLEAQDRHRREERRVDVPALAVDYGASRRAAGGTRRDRHDLSVRTTIVPDAMSGPETGWMVTPVSVDVFVTAFAPSGRRRRQAAAAGVCARPDESMRTERERRQRSGRLHRPPSALRLGGVLLVLVLVRLVLRQPRLRLRDEIGALLLERRPRREIRGAVEVLLALDPGLERDAVVESGSPFQITKSPSLPASSEPTRSSMPSCFAGFDVTNASASAGGTPPYLTALRGLDVEPPRELVGVGVERDRDAALPHQREGVGDRVDDLVLVGPPVGEAEAPAPWRAISSAIL